MSFNLHRKWLNKHLAIFLTEGGGTLVIEHPVVGAGVVGAGVVGAGDRKSVV